MKQNLTNYARNLRRDQTEAERKLWRHLRSKQMQSVKFRRQQPIGSYIVDFVCFEKKLIIELDGSQHIDDKEKDVIRDCWLTEQGFIVKRFWNNDVMNNIDRVLRTIYEMILSPSPAPPVEGGV
ncbi:MAG: endonuclease domain-containing protein [Spirochaetota bacterium]